MSEQLTPCATWRDDAQGKKDFDGRLISISCRYWPGPREGGSITYDAGTGEFGTAPYGSRPTAFASIVLNHGHPDRYGYSQSRTLHSVKIEADTEEEVKARVEAWVQERFDALYALLGPGLEA